MQIFRDIEPIRNFIAKQKASGRRVGLVPTMGALHDGHLSLVRRCQAETDLSMATIFVNPLQFNNPSDLQKYPRTFDDDIELLDSVGCQAVFCPAPEDMYQQQPQVQFDFGGLDKILEGKFRPGHFSGVAIVVSKLFNIIQPDVAYFGQKDYQQFLIIRQLVQDLSFPIQLVCGEIIREADGLAMSSRNQRLSPDERKMAHLIFQCLSKGRENIRTKHFSEIKKETESMLANTAVRLEYLELANPSNLTALPEFDPTVHAILLIAAYVGDVRLIDNMFI